MNNIPVAIMFALVPAFIAGFILSFIHLALGILVGFGVFGLGLDVMLRGK